MVIVKKCACVKMCFMSYILLHYYIIKCYCACVS